MQRNRQIFWDIFWRVHICSIIQKVEESTQMILKNLCMIPTMQKCQSIHILILIWTIGCLMKMAVMLEKSTVSSGKNLTESNLKKLCPWNDYFL
mgnify:FL=1